MSTRTAQSTQEKKSMAYPQDLELVRCEVADGVALVTLDNAARRNSITTKMVEELCAVFDAVESDPAVGAVVITGEGPAFCAGADLQHLVNASHGDDEAAASVRSIYEAFKRVASCPLPTLAAVNGPAVGAGLNMALACDIRIAGRSAAFMSRFLTLGLHPGGGHTWMLSRAVGAPAATAMVMFGCDVDGAEAQRIGLAWECVDDDQLVARAREVASRASAAPRELAMKAKSSIREMGLVEDYEEAIEIELEKQLWSVQQDDFTTRMAKFGVKPDRKN